ncbi:MAG: hypothetical protein M3020_14470 [Myxococcota bacterium]|nr:hypothetical protein [Myxococcota bacterium]
MNRLLRQSLLAGAAAIAVLCWGSEGSAEAPEVRAHLEVVAGGGCGGEAELAARVARRSSRIRFVEPGPGVRRARAELRAAGNELFAATLSLWTDEGRELVRRVRPARCPDALEALSLVLAVSLDPDAELGEAPAPTPAAEPEGSTTTEAAPSASASASAAPSGASAKPQPRPEPAELEGRERESEPEPSGNGARYRPFAGVFGSVRGGPAPGFMPGFGVFAGVLGPGFPSEFAVRLGVSRHRRSGFRVEQGAAEFELDAVRLELCPIGLRLGLAFFHACLDGELGELEATGSGLPDSRAASRPWRALGGSGWAGLRPWPVLELSLGGGLEHPLVRDRFAFNPEVFHEVGPVGGWLSLGLGLAIP